jgi:hypothetical protein
MVRRPKKHIVATGVRIVYLPVNYLSEARFLDLLVTVIVTQPFSLIRTIGDAHSITYA